MEVSFFFCFKKYICFVVCDYINLCYKQTWEESLACKIVFVGLGFFLTAGLEIKIKLLFPFVL